ncbi:MAG: DEAD/DEAH box helicase [Acidimicrobiia bacterium]|jgi:superfamily II DNA/RNA helicase/cold shock CspA family protein
MESFADLGVPNDVVSTLRARGIDAPFPIQAMTVADGMAGRDVSGKAHTGSGKTLAFGIPMVTRLGKAQPHRPLGLVLVPTRELASQVCGELTWLGRARKLRVAAVYGGAGFGAQLKAMRRGTDILVACPGRLKDLIERREVDLSAVETVVIDEADRMADMGFLPEVRKLLDQTPDTRQTLLFSATLDGAVDSLVRNYQKDPVRHVLADDPEQESLATHIFWRADRDAKVQLTADVIRLAGPTIVFCRTKHGTDALAKKLGRLGVRVETIHGNRSQGQRERALGAFAAGKVDALLATDVAARGIHVDDVACVLHFDPPNDEKDYTHRSGRTARAGAHGFVISLVMPDQVKVVKRMQRVLDLPESVEIPSRAALAAITPDGVSARRVDEVVAQSVPPEAHPVPAKGARTPRGTIKFFDTKRGFGFIDRGTGTDLFVHHSSLDVAGHRLKEGALVEFEVGEGRKGEEALRVRLARV